MSITPDTKVKDVLETQVCSRCGGTGHYSFNQIDGTVCYGCGGQKVQYTKRGAAALALYRNLTSVPGDMVREGDRIFMKGYGWATVTGVSTDPADQSMGHYVATQAEAQAAADRGARVDPPANEEPKSKHGWAVYEGITIQTNRMGTSLRPGLYGTFQMGRLDPQVWVAVLKTVAEYQESLTKTGKPRKGSRWDTTQEVHRIREVPTTTQEEN